MFYTFRISIILILVLFRISSHTNFWSFQGIITYVRYISVYYQKLVWDRASDLSPLVYFHLFKNAAVGLTRQWH